jgi:hypothetical protein
VRERPGVIRRTCPVDSKDFRLWLDRGPKGTLVRMPLRSASAFITTNVLVNRPLIAFLKGRSGARLGRRLAVVEYRGCRSGRRTQLVTRYVAHGRRVRIEVGMADRKTWWRNFSVAYPVRLWLAGEQHDATAYVVRHGAQLSVIAELQRAGAPRRNAQDTGAVSESDLSLASDRAENRMHPSKPVIVTTLGHR